LRQGQRPIIISRLLKEIAMLVNCVAYQGGKKLADISVEAISDYVAKPDCFVWVALKDPEPSELAKMQEEFGLHELAVEDARHGHQRPKIEEYDEMLFAVLKTVELVDDELKFGEVDVFVGANYVLTVRTHSDQGFAGVRARCEREPELLRYGAGFVLYALMDAVVDRYFPVLDEIELELDELEEQIFKRGSERSNVQRLYGLKQKIMALKHVGTPLLEASGKLFGGRVPPVCVNTQEYFRDVYDHLYRINQTIENIRDMVNTAMQVNLSLITLAENEVTKKLAAWAAIIAIPTMVAGIYGMNFRHMPELDWVFGYPLSVALMVAIDVWLYVKFKKVKWL
jgi:magnesium transporter